MAMFGQDVRGAGVGGEHRAATASSSKRQQPQQLQPFDLFLRVRMYALTQQINCFLHPAMGPHTCSALHVQNACCGECNANVACESVACQVVHRAVT